MFGDFLKFLGFLDLPFLLPCLTIENDCQFTPLCTILPQEKVVLLSISVLIFPVPRPFSVLILSSLECHTSNLSYMSSSDSFFNLTTFIPGI